MSKVKKRGRPPLPKGQAKVVIKPIRFTETELRLYEQAATANRHESLSSWIRHTLNSAAEKYTKPVTAKPQRRAISLQDRA
jgi:hypothetical protein